MGKIDDEARNKYKSWMAHLKGQRIERGVDSQKDLADRLGLSEGYTNKLENGQLDPSSLINHFKYLIVNDFDLSPLFRVRIHPEGDALNEEKKELIRKIKEDFDEDIIGYLVEIVEVAKLYRLKARGR